MNDNGLKATSNHFDFNRFIKDGKIEVLNSYIETAHILGSEGEIKSFWLFNNLKVGEFYHYLKIVKLHGQRYYLYGSKTIDRDGNMEFLIIVSLKKPEQLMVYYKQRWQIESLFRSLKAVGLI